MSHVDQMIVLPVRCTVETADRLRLAGVVAHAVEDLRWLDEEKHETARRHKERKEALVNKLREAAEAIRTGKEERPVDCRVIRDMEKGVERTVRVDTGEVVRERTLTVEERQLALRILGGPEAPTFKPGGKIVHAIVHAAGTRPTRSGAANPGDKEGGDE